MFNVILSAGVLRQDEANRLDEIQGVFVNIIRGAIPLGAIVLFVFLMLAGVNLISAGNDPKKAESARNMATYAVIGMFFLAAAYLIIRFISVFTGATQIETFQVVQP